VASVAEKAGMTKKDAEKAVESVLLCIEEALEKGEKVAFVGHFSLEGKQTKPRVGRNPATNEEIQIPASRKVKFKAGKLLSDAVLKVPIVEE
jgi:DNA-binding protein HU-beta